MPISPPWSTTPNITNQEGANDFQYFNPYHITCATHYVTKYVFNINSNLKTVSAATSKNKCWNKKQEML